MRKTIYLDTRFQFSGEKEPEISFIVPVFNTQSYLVETLDSIAADNLDKIELIVVNDGSMDDSLNIIRNWAEERQLPVLILDQPNSGLSAARMTGLAHARGRFIGFCDSDDKIEISTYRNLAKLAIESDSDVAICRSVVFDELTYNLSDFYDSKIWKVILAGKNCVVTNIMREPLLPRIEPNANTRLLRRSFIVEAGITFPYGLHFEDLPPHILELSKARKVILLDSTGYFYRVNRIGKITDQKNAKRFDIIICAEQAFDIANKLHLKSQSWANVLILVCRMIYWCGENTLNSDRQHFFVQASKLIQEKVSQKIIEECISKWSNQREAILICALATGSIEFLSLYSAKHPMSLVHLIKLMGNRKFGQVPRRVATCMLVDYSKRFVRHFMKNFLD